MSAGYRVSGSDGPSHTPRWMSPADTALATEPRPILTFDPELHAYTINGIQVPSVTKIVGSVYPRYQVDDFYLNRGRVIHKCAELLLQGKKFTVDERVAGRVEAVKLFLNQTQFQAEVTEQQMGSEKYMFAGTLDAVGSLQGRQVILDWKSSRCPEPDFLQLVGYSILCGVHYGLTVVLNDNGQYNMSEVYKLKSHQRKFLAALAVYKMRGK